jgi:hypothetical protein
MKKIIFALFLLAVAGFSSCKKATYERRLDGSWMITKYTENGTDKTQDFKAALPNYTITFSKSSHTFTETATYGIFTLTVSGNFTISSDNKQVVLTNTSPTTEVRPMSIIKIKKNELVLEEANNTAKRYYLGPK